MSNHLRHNLFCIQKKQVVNHYIDKLPNFLPMCSHNSMHQQEKTAN